MYLAFSNHGYHAGWLVATGRQLVDSAMKGN